MPTATAFPLRVRWLFPNSAFFPLALLALLAGAASAHAQPGWEQQVDYGYQVETWSVDEGLPQNSSQRVMQAPDGSLLVTGYGTPARFDGHTFAPMPLKGVPNGRTVPGHGIMRCPDGGICVVVPGEGVWRMRGDSLVQHIATLDAYYYARSEYHDALLVATRGEDADLYLVDADTTTRLGPIVPGGISREDVLTIGRDSTVYVHAKRGGGIWTLKPGHSWTLLSEAVIGTRVFLLTTDTTGATWVLGEAGIYRVTEGDLVAFSDLPWSRHLVRYGEGYLSAGRTGVHRLRADGSVRDTLATTNANWLHVDASGTIWAALEAEGVMRIHPHRIGRIPLGGYEKSGVRSLMDARDGSAWTTGNCDGALHFTPDGQRTRYLPSDERGLPTPQRSLLSNCLWTLARDEAGRIWTSGMGGRMHVIERGAIRLLDGTPEASGWELLGGSTAIFTDRDGTIWTSRRRDGRVYRRDASGAFAHVPFQAYPDSTSHNAAVLQFFQAMDGTIWAGGPGFVARFDTTAFVPVLRVEHTTRTFAQSRDGTLYVGTYGGGIYRLDYEAQQRALSRALAPHEAPRFRHADGLPDDFVSFLHLDERGRLWSTHNQGLARTHRAELDAYLDTAGSDRTPPHVRVFTAADGLPSTEFNGGFQGAGLAWDDGTVWLPTLKGIAVLDPDRADDEQAPPTPFIRAVQIDGIDAPCASPTRCALDLSASDQRIRIDIGSLAISSTRNVETNVRLRPGSEAWERLAPTESSITYAALAGGSYVLEARTRSPDGTWSPPRSLATLDVATPFYEALWFWGLMIGAGAAALVFGVRVHDRTLRQRAERLQHAVAQRTDELRVAAARLEAQNAALADLVASKERVMRMVSHDLKSPIGGIVGLAEIVEEEVPADSEAGEMASLIRQAGEQSLRLIHTILLAEHDEAPTTQELPVVDFRNVVADALKLAQGIARTKQQRLHAPFYLIDDAPLSVRADPLRLRLVADNLISNALKYAPHGSDVHVALAHDSDAGVYAVLTVDDAGPGIPPEQWERVFDPYTRLEAEPTGAETATGLGLFLARETVHTYGGTIHAGASPYGGARFTVRIPLAEDATTS